MQKAEVMRTKSKIPTARATRAQPSPRGPILREIYAPPEGLDFDSFDSLGCHADARSAGNTPVSKSERYASSGGTTVSRVPASSVRQVEGAEINAAWRRSP